MEERQSVCSHPDAWSVRIHQPSRRHNGFWVEVEGDHRRPETKRSEREETAPTSSIQEPQSVDAARTREPRRFEQGEKRSFSLADRVRIDRLGITTPVPTETEPSSFAEFLAVHELERRIERRIWSRILPFQS